MSTYLRPRKTTEAVRTEPPVPTVVVTDRGPFNNSRTKVAYPCSALRKKCTFEWEELNLGNRQLRRETSRSTLGLVERKSFAVHYAQMKLGAQR